MPKTNYLQSFSIYHTISSKIEINNEIKWFHTWFSYTHIYAYTIVLYDMFYFVCRFDGGSNVVGFHDCLPNNDTCSLSYRLNNDVSEGDVVNIDSLIRTSGRYYTVNYSTSESMSGFFAFMTNWYSNPNYSIICICTLI